MKAGEPLKADERIVKYVPPRLKNDDGTVDGYVFLPRVVDKDGSSVHILCYYSDDVERSLGIIRSQFRLRLAATGVFAETTVCELERCADELRQGGKLSVIYDPLPKDADFPADDAHALVLGLPFQGVMDELVSLKFSSSVHQLHPAKS